MFAVGLRGHPALSVSIFFIVVVIFGGPCVHGRPTEAESWQDTRRDQPQSSPPLSPLRYSPELMLEPSLESAVSPVNVLPRPLPPSSPSYNNPPSSNDHNTVGGSYNNVGSYNNNWDNHNTNLGNPHNEDNHQQGNHDNADNQNRNRVVAGEFFKEFSQDLDGPEEKWEQDPDLVDSELVPAPQSWPQRVPTELPQNKVMEPPAVVEDDVNVDKFHGHLLGFHEADGNEDLEVPELRLKIQNHEPFHSASTGSEYVPAVPRTTVDQDASSTEVITGAAKAETPSSPKANIPMPDDVPVNPHRALPWQEVLAKDIDVDKPIPHNNASPPVPPPASHLPDTSLQHWKPLEELDEARHTATHGGDGNMASTEVYLDRERNPFEDEEEEEEENEVPEELVRRVVEAMEAPPFWRLSAAGAEDEEDMGDMWESSGDGQGEDDDEYLDYWVLPQHDSPWNSRLLTLILETVDDPEEILIYQDEDMEEEEEGENSTDSYEKELSIWQILTNFPFPMLLHHSDDTTDPFNDDYIYDDDEDYEDYDDEDYDEDDYEDDYEDEYNDEYDDEDYEDEDDEGNEDEEEDGDGSDSLDDYFYSEDYDDCEDCKDDDGEAKPETAILSLPPIFTK